MSLSKIALGAFMALCASVALARGPFVPSGGPAGFAGAYPAYPVWGYPIVSYTSRASAPLVGSWERGGSSLSVVGAVTPDAEWTPMFSDPVRKPTVQGVPIASMRGSAKGSYIYVAPGRKGKEFSTMIEGLPPEGTIEWSKK